MKKSLNFVAHYFLLGKLYACRLFVTGFFYVCTLTICGSVPPCKSVMDLLLPKRSNATGKAGPFFISSPYLKFCKMHNTEKNKAPLSKKIGEFQPIIKDLHADSREAVIKSLQHQSKAQIIKDFLIEMDAKNTALYFIMENGHFDAFADYCNSSKTP